MGRRRGGAGGRRRVLCPGCAALQALSAPNRDRLPGLAAGSPNGCLGPVFHCSRPVRRIRPCASLLSGCSLLSCSRRPWRGHQAARRPRSRRRPGSAVDQLVRPAAAAAPLLFLSTSFVRGRSPPPCPMTSAANGSCCCWSQRPSVPGGLAGRGIVLSSVPWLNWVPSPPAAWSWSYEPPGPSAAPAAGHRDRGLATRTRPDRGAAFQPLDHRTRHPPIRLAEPAPRRRLPGKPTRPCAPPPRPATSVVQVGRRGGVQNQVPGRGR